MNIKFYISLGLSLWLCACSGTDGGKKITPDVHFAEVGVRDIPVYQTYVGQTYGLSDIDIQARVDGWLTGIHFKEGTFVSQGQLLYTIDDQPIQTKVDAAKASLAEANTKLVKAKSDYERVKPLAEMNALSKRDLDNAIAMYEAAQSEVEIADARLKTNEIELGYTRITAPITGLIGISKTQVGAYVSRGMGASQALNTISQIDKIRVRFSITENNYLSFRKAIVESGGDLIEKKQDIPITLILNDGTVYPEAGALDIVDREINPATGAMLVQAIFDNKEKMLRPGQFVKIRIQTEALKDAIVVPQSAVNQMQNIYQVFVLTAENKLEARIVEVGDRIGSNWVIKNGLSAGEKVVTLGNVSLIKADVPLNPVDMQWDYDKTMNDF
ncbi:MAG: efflux RND transporter periplasmic adaptor subunit [Bacteroidales bacterium]|nr:efflux RND transporter periplasmic adaptor subunit [Bacteroidales bacterium]